MIPILLNLDKTAVSLLIRFFLNSASKNGFDFIEKKNFIHKGIVEDKNVITGIGMFFKEFAEAVLRRFDYDIGDHFMAEKADDFTEEELTFYWTDDDYKEFLDELKSYE